jgi:hypothetical protein
MPDDTRPETIAWRPATDDAGGRARKTIILAWFK